MSDVQEENQSPPSDVDRLEAAVGVLRDRVKALQRDLDKGKKALDALARKTTHDKIGRLEDASADLAAVDFAAFGLETLRDEVVAAADAIAGELRRTVRQRILPDLRQRAVDEGVGFDMIGDSPPVIVLSPCTITLDTERARAEVAYAREIVVETPLTADAVIAGWHQAKKQIKEKSVASEIFFEQLHAAYQMTLTSSGLAPGERVDIVDLLGPLAVLSQARDNWRNARAFQPYPRYLLAYQLARLRRDGLLERRGKRMVLGTATGGSTRNKRNVLFVPVSVTDGQYYLSIAFTAGNG